MTLRVSSGHFLTWIDKYGLLLLAGQLAYLQNLSTISISLEQALNKVCQWRLSCTKAVIITHACKERMAEEWIDWLLYIHRSEVGWWWSGLRQVPCCFCPCQLCLGRIDFAEAYFNCCYNFRDWDASGCWGKVQTFFNTPFSSVDRIRRKVHKPEVTLRPIVCFIGSSTYNPSQHLCCVVYQIPCGGCKKVYIRQTGRTLEHCLKERRRALVSGNAQQSAVAEHASNEMHDIDWEKVEVVDCHTHTHYLQRCALEARHIRTETHSMNRDVRRPTTICVQPTNPTSTKSLMRSHCSFYYICVS